jgi:hypothetical protein
MTILRLPRPPVLSKELFRTTTLRRCTLDECRAACCLHGVWLDPLEREDILEHAGAVLPHLPADRRDPAAWFGDTEEPDGFYPSGRLIPTTIRPNPAHYGGTECVFLRPDWLCALQVASAAAGEDPWRWKPFHCIIHPITIEAGTFTLAADEELRAEPGGCFRDGETTRRMSESLAPEIEFLRTAGHGGPVGLPDL